MNAAVPNSLLSRHRGVLWILFVTLVLFLLLAMVAASSGQAASKLPQPDAKELESQIQTLEGRQ